MEIETWYINRERNKIKNNKFWKQLPSRIDAWKRDIFPSDIINRLLTDLKLKQEWKACVYNRIYVLASNGKFYSLVNDVDTISFQRENETKPYFVCMRLNNGEEYQVFTPVVNGVSRPMQVYNLREVAIDHVIPLNCIVNRVLKDNKAIREDVYIVMEARRKYRGVEPKDIADKIRDKVNVQLLREFKNEVLEDTICVLMEQGENSRKSDITPFLRYEKDGNKYEFIVAEHVLNPADQKSYTIFYTFEDMVFSEIRMKTE